MQLVRAPAPAIENCLAENNRERGVSVAELPAARLRGPVESRVAQRSIHVDGRPHMATGSTTDEAAGTRGRALERCETHRHASSQAKEVVAGAEALDLFHERATLAQGGRHR